MSEGWFGIDNQVIDQYGAAMGPIALAVYAVLKRYAGNTRETWPQIETLSERTGASRRAVIQALQRLEGLHLIEIERTVGARNHYLICNVPSTCAPDAHPDANTCNPVEECTTCTRAPGAPVQEVHGGSAPGARVLTHIEKDSITKTQREGAHTRPAPDTDPEAADEKPRRKRFTPPKLEEVQAYMAEIGIPGEAEPFHDFHTARGWRVGREPMKDWRAACRTWKHRLRDFRPQSTGPPGRAAPARSREQEEAEALERIRARQRQEATGFG